MTDGRLVMVGCGRMGSALLSQWLSSKSWRGPVTIVKPTPELKGDLRDNRSIDYAPSLAEMPADPVAPSLVVLAAKPQQLVEILPQCTRRFGEASPYLTIAAGLRISVYRKHLGAQARIVRTMPNTPSLIGRGMTTLCASDTATEQDRSTVEDLMNAVGQTLWLDDEAMMDVATAISGSGPAYVYYFMECLISAAIEAGLDEGAARFLVMQTVNGSSELAARSDVPLATLRRDVTSPGGTTEAALSHLMQPAGMPSILQAAVTAAIDRARELTAAAR